MDINIYSFLTNPECKDSDICTLLCEYNKLTDPQKDDFFEYRHLSNAFFQFFANDTLLIRVLSVENIDEDVLYLFEEHFEASNFTYHQAIRIMRQYLTHEENIDVCTIEELIEHILDDCKIDEVELTKTEIEELINWFKKYMVINKLPMINFLYWLLNSKKLTHEEVKMLCNSTYMPSYNEIADL